MFKRRSIGVLIGLSALAAAMSTAYADETYIPLISKGFQHQFWQ